MVSKRIAVLGLVALVLISGFSVFEIPEGVKAEPYGGVLRVGIKADITSRNILNAGDNEWNWKVLSPIYDTPIKTDNLTGLPMVHIIKGTDINGAVGLQPGERGEFDFLDGFTNEFVAYYDFAGVRFHDGTQVDVMDIIFSYHIVALHPYWYTSTEPLMDGGGLTGNFSSTRWLWVWDVSTIYSADGDDNTSALRFHLTTNYSRVWTDLIGIPIFPQHILEGTGGGIHADFGCAIDSNGYGIPVTNSTSYDMTAVMAWEPADDEVIGNGPFEFDGWATGSHVNLTTYIDYYPGRAYIDGISFRIYSSVQATDMALKAGEVDAIGSSVPPSYVSDLQSNPFISIIQAPEMYYSYLGFNMRSSVFGYLNNNPAQGDTGKALRTAVAYLINKSTIVSSYLEGYGVPGRGPISLANAAWYNASLPDYAFNLTMAEFILDNAGLQDNDGDGWRDIDTNTSGDQDDQIDILSPPLDYDPVLAQVCTHLETNMQMVALNASCSYQSYQSIISSIETRSFDMYLLYWDDSVLDPWSIELGDPDYLYDLYYGMHSASGRNHVGFQNLTFDSKILTSRGEMNQPNRQSQIRQTQGSIVENLPVNPIYYRTGIWAYRNDRFINWTMQNSIFNYWSYIGIYDSGDTKPTIVVWQPGGSTGQTYLQGDSIQVTWTANDDNPLPANTINITYGNLIGGWTTIATNETNDGTYYWDTSGVACPGTYWMNLTVYDSIGQESYSLSAFNFTIVCPDEPPTIEVLEPGGSTEQSFIRGNIVQVTWTASDNNPLPVTPINISYGDPITGWTMVAFHEPNDGYYDWDTSSVPCPGTYWMNLSVYDSLGQMTFDEGNYSFYVGCPDSTPPTADAGPDQAVPQGTLVTFNGTGSSDDSGSIADYTWVFQYEGDQVTLYGADPSFIFERFGDYEVTLTVQDPSGNLANDTVWINVTGVDTDSDGLTDYDEYNLYGTDPEIADTDRDGINDGDEVANGTNPLVPESIPPSGDLLSEYWWLLVMLAAIIVALILFLFFGKKKRSEDEARDFEEIESGASGADDAVKPEEGTVTSLKERTPGEEVGGEDAIEIIEEAEPGDAGEKAEGIESKTTGEEFESEDDGETIEEAETEDVEGETEGAEGEATEKEGEMFECPSCNTLLPIASTTCSNCGAEFADEEVVEIECPECGTTITGESSRCPHCGTAFEMAPKAPEEIDELEPPKASVEPEELSDEERDERRKKEALERKKLEEEIDRLLEE